MTKDIAIYQAENIVFRYFKYIKIYKFFCKESMPTKFVHHDFITNISNILKSCNLAPHEESVILHFGNRLHRPLYNSRYRSSWDSAISKIAIELLDKGYILHDVK